MRIDPLVLGARRHGEAETARLRGVEPVHDTGEDNFAREQLISVRAASFLQRIDLHRDAARDCSISKISSLPTVPTSAAHSSSEGGAQSCSSNTRHHDA